MNRSTDHEFDQRIADWLEDDPNLAPRQALDTVLAAFPSIPQRRTWRAPRRFQTMSVPIRLATAAVIGVLVVGGALYLARSAQPSVGMPGPTPATSPSAAASPSQASAWRLTGPPAEDRGFNGITVGLLDGRVLTASGGRNASKTAELYDPRTGTWTATGSLHEGRSYAITVRLDDGKVLVAGGDNAGSNGSSAETFDPATGVWTVVGQMTESRGQAFAAVLSDGKVLVAGGGMDVGLKKTAELFDPVTAKWTPTGDMIDGRAGPLSALRMRDGRVLVAGGFADDKTSAEIYDPTTGLWAATGKMDVQHVDEQTGIALTDGRILIAGGRPTSADLFDPTTEAWTASDAMDASTDLTACVALPDGTVLLVGGGTSVTFATTQIFDPATNLWSSAQPMTRTRYVRSATLLPSGTVLVVGKLDQRWTRAFGRAIRRRLLTHGTARTAAAPSDQPIVRSRRGLATVIVLISASETPASRRRGRKVSLRYV